MYLQLAEGEFRGRARAGRKPFPFIYLPDLTGRQKGIYVREDNLDTMSDGDFNQLMEDVAPYQGMAEGEFLLSSKASRAKRKEKKIERKGKRQEAKAIRKQTKADRPASERTGTALIKGLTSTAQGIFGKGGGAPADETPAGAERTSPGSSGGGGGEKKPFYKNPWVIGGALALVVGGVFLATRKKSA